MDKPLWITGFSKGHEELFCRHFLPSFEGCGLRESFNLQVRSIDWNATFDDPAFNDHYKGEMIRMLVEFRAHPGRLVVSSGCDFHFYRPTLPVIIREALTHGNFEITCLQDHRDVLCTCLFAAVSTERICRFLEAWITQRPEVVYNQERFNMLIREMGLHYSRLPFSCWTHGLHNIGEWKNGDLTWLPDPPPDIVLHHANWAVGAPNKLLLLDEIERRVKAL